MEANNESKQGDSASSTEAGQMKLQIRTARVQKFITVDENISIKDVSNIHLSRVLASSSIECHKMVVSFLMSQALTNRAISLAIIQ